MKARLFANLSTGRVSDTLSGSAYVWPTLTQGDQLQIHLPLSERIEGQNVAVQKTVVGLRAAIGRVDEPPSSGEIGFTVEGSDVAALTYPFTASALETALTAVEGSITSVFEQDGSFFIEAPSELEFGVHKNCLAPRSTARFRSWECDTGEWRHEIRLQQLPVAMTSTFTRQVPKAPYFVEDLAGGSTDDTEWPEEQLLFVPPDFVGTYRIRRGIGQYTKSLSRANDYDEVKAALDEIADEDGSFTVEEAFYNAARVKFEGSMAGIDQPLLEVEVVSAPEGDVTFFLDLDTGELADVFREAGVNQVKLPFECELEIEDEFDDEITRVHTIWRTEVTINEEIARPVDGVSTPINYLRPPQRDFIPVDPSSVITGSQHYTSAFGNGVDTEFTFDHLLGTASLHATIRENSGGGLQLVHGTDYTLAFDSDDALTVDVSAWSGGVPAAGELAITITTAGPKDALTAHTQAMSTVDGLIAAFDSVGDRLLALEALAPGSIALSSADGADYSEEWDLPDFWEVFPVLGTPPEAPSSRRVKDLDPAALPSFTPPLYPAIHDASATALPTETSGIDTVPQSPATVGSPGTLFQNQTGGDVVISLNSPVETVEDPYGYTFTLPDDGYCTHDGEEWYPLEQYGDGAQTSYYAKPLERTLFQDVILASQLPAGRQYETRFAIDLAALRANTPWHWHVVVEIAALGQDASPATTGGNLATVDWVAAPVLDEKVVLMTTPRTYEFGYRVARNSKTKQVEEITCVADVAGSLDATWFQLEDEDGTVGVWIDVDDDGASIPPGADALDRPIEVTGVSSGDSAEDVAVAIAAALDADPKFSASAAAGVVSVTHATAGVVGDGEDGDTGFSFEVVTDGHDGITASKLIFGEWSSTTAPATAEFAIRARLVRADAVNAVAAPRGFLVVGGLDFSELAGKATIQ